MSDRYGQPDHGHAPETVASYDWYQLYPDSYAPQAQAPADRHQPYPDGSFAHQPEPVPADYLGDTATILLLPVEQAEPEPGYTVPDVPEAGWSMDDTPRRRWTGRALLAVILLFQALLSLRLHNTAFQDEALYLYAGHAELQHLLHGTPVTGDYDAYFSGSPLLYPVLAAVVDQHFGLTGARLLSLAMTLGTTGLLYSFTRRLFNVRVALAAAALFSVTQTAIGLGNFATYDAAALFLLALTTWLAVRTAAAPAVAVLLAAPVAVLAVGVKYASALYLPTIVVLALLAAWPHRGKRAVLHALLLTMGIAGLVAVGLYSTHLMTGVRSTTTARAHGTESAASLVEKSVQWGGLLFAVACGGALSYIRRSRMNESPATVRLGAPGRRWRTSLALLLCGTALLAPAYQVHLHTSVSLWKHIGYGLLFAAPMAGIGLTRLVGAHFRHPQLGILVWVVALALGISQSTWRFDVWPNTARLTAVLRAHVDDRGHYLSTAADVPIYYLRDLTTSEQWTSTYFIHYKDRHGVTHSGDDGYRRAIADGWFDLVVLDGVTTPDTTRMITREVEHSSHYRLLAKLPFSNATGSGAYQVWVKQ